MSPSPRVVALGGGHGTAVTLRAARRYARDIVAIVSVADDGGSSGRLRELLDVPALGDLRKCLLALCDETSPFARTMDYRFTEGELAGHAIGNLVLAGLLETTGDLVIAVDQARSLLGGSGTILPATTTSVTLRSQTLDGVTDGQVAVANESANRRVSILPATANSPVEALSAIAEADQILIGPGSLFTSVLAAVSAPQILDALRHSSAQKVVVCNLRPQIPETQGFTVEDHERALDLHGVPFDFLLGDLSLGIERGSPSKKFVEFNLCTSSRPIHDPGKLALALSALYGDSHDKKESA